jgi:CRP/FNR family transcriptional regulator, cyclic AMP receptor protein
MRRFSQDTKVQALKHAPLFADLSRKELVALARLADDVEVPEGTTLCREGELGSEFFVLLEGGVTVTRNGRKLATGGPGDFFGEVALVEDVPRTASIRATSQLRFFVLTGPSFRRLLEDSPSVERKVLRALARRLIAASRDPVLA